MHLKNNFMYLWLCWGFVAAWAFLQLWQAGAPLQLEYAGSSVPLTRSSSYRPTTFSSYSTWAQRLQLQAPEHGPIVVAHRLSCSEAWGIFLDQ